MNNFQWQFLDCNSNPLSGKKVLLTPTRIPEITASLQSVGDSYQFTCSVDGIISSSIVPSTYKVDINAPTPATSFYLVATETGSYVYSGSFRTGSAQCVFFDLINLHIDDIANKKVTLTPEWNYPVNFSGSIVALPSTTSLTDANGYVTFDALVPGPYFVQVFSKIESSWYISVPAWENTGSDAPCWNAKDLIIVKPSKGIKVRVSNLDDSYVLTVSSSDARYAPRYSFATSSNAISSSYANTASFAWYSKFSEITTSYVQIGSEVSASWASSSLSASYLNGSARLEPTDRITFYDGINFMYLVPDNDAFKFYASSWGLGKEVRIGDGCQVTADYFVGTASIAISSSFSDTSSVAISASWAPPIPSESASYAETASYALNASAQSSVSASWASASISSSYALSASKVLDVYTDGGTTIIGNQAGSFGWLGVPYVVNGATIIGATAGATSATSSNAVQIGYRAGGDMYGGNNTEAVQIGFYAGANMADARESVVLGTQAARYVANGFRSVFIGSAASGAPTANNAVVIGYNSKGGTCSTAIGNNVSASANEMILGCATTTRTTIRGPITASVVSASFVGRLNGSASYALSASWAPSTDASVSASYALTASVLEFINKSGSLNEHTSAVVISGDTASYDAVWYDYACVSGSNKRAGTVMATWYYDVDLDQNFVQYNEVSTVDIGDTSLVTLSVGISGSAVCLYSDCYGTGTDWYVKAVARYV